MKSPAPPSSNVAGGLAPKIHRLWDAGCSGVQTSTTFSAPWMKTRSSPRSLSRPLSARCRDKACVALPWAGMGMPIRDSLDNPGPASHRGAGLGLPRAGSPGKRDHSRPVLSISTAEHGPEGEQVRECCCSRPGSPSCSRQSDSCWPSPELPRLPSAGHLATTASTFSSAVKGALCVALPGPVCSS